VLTIDTPERVVYIFTVLVQNKPFVESIDAAVRRMLVDRQPHFADADMLSPVDEPELYRTAFIMLELFVAEQKMKIEKIDKHTGVLTIRDQTGTTTNERAVRLMAFSSGNIREMAKAKEGA
jgi:hypothetical protein